MSVIQRIIGDVNVNLHYNEEEVLFQTSIPTGNRDNQDSRRFEIWNLKLQGRRVPRTFFFSLEDGIRFEIPKSCETLFLKPAVENVRNNVLSIINSTPTTN